MSLALREELAHVTVADAAERRAEVAAVSGFAGTLHVLGDDAPSGPGPYWVLRLQVGAVARRAWRTLVEDLALRPHIEVHRPTGPRHPRQRHAGDYRLLVALPRPAAEGGGPPEIGPRRSDPGRSDPGRSGPGRPSNTERAGLRHLGLVDRAGAPLPAPAVAAPVGAPARRGWLRGALMAAGSLSAPDKSPHLEVACPSRVVAEDLAAVLGEYGAPGATAGTRPGRPSGRQTGAAPRHRVVVKSGAGIGSVLVEVGAHQAFLDRDLAALERRLRSTANRAANADRANLDRAARAAVRQVAEIEAALDRAPPGDVPDEVLETALARLANPQASLSQVGSLLHPPISRATVHRRIRRLIELAEGADPARG